MLQGSRQLRRKLSLPGSLALLLLLLFVCVLTGIQISIANANAGNDVTPPLIYEWGGRGSEDGLFKWPEAIAVDAGDNVYVADTGNNRIQKFSASGAYISQWDGSTGGGGQLKDPDGIAVDSLGHVYVADPMKRIVQEFDSDGTYIKLWGGAGSATAQFGLPGGIAVDSFDGFYVADLTNHHIDKFDSTGNLSAEFGSAQLVLPQDVAVDGSGNVYVANSASNRIEKYDSSGTYLTGWGGRGSGDGQFIWPSAVAVDGRGYVYVADTDNNRIQVFDTGGGYLNKWGDGSVFNMPMGIAVDGSGNVYVADTRHDRILVFGALAIPTPTSTPTATRVPSVTAVNDAAGTLGGTPVTIHPLANDIDPQGRGLTIAAVTQPAGGTVTIAADAQSLTYTPKQGFAGLELFDYTAEDVNGATAGSVIAVIITPPNNVFPPQAAPVINTATTTATFIAGGVESGGPPTTLVLPPGSYDGAHGELGPQDIFFLSYAEVPAPPPAMAVPPANLVFVDDVFELNAYRNEALLGGYNFPQPITVTLTYSPPQISTVNPATIGLRYWDSVSQTWSQDGITFVNNDPSHHRVSFTIKHFSDYAWFAAPAPTGEDPLPEPAAGGRLYLPAVTR